MSRNLFRHYKDPEVYYVITPDLTAGVIACYIQHQPFRYLTFGSVDHASYFRAIEDYVSTQREKISKGTTSTKVHVNVLADLAGNIASFLPIDDKGIRVVNKRSLTSVNASIVERIQAPIEKKVVNDIHYHLTYEVNNDRLHGTLFYQDKSINYIAVYFEGTIIMDAWFNDTLLGARNFGKTVKAFHDSVDTWPFNYTISGSTLFVGNVTIPIELEFGTVGKRVKAGPLTIKYTPLYTDTSPYRISMSRYNISVFIDDYNTMAAVTDCLNPHLQTLDYKRKLVITQLINELH